LLRRSRRNKSSPDLIRGSTKGPLGNERPFLSAPLFALFYQVEIRHPQPKNEKALAGFHAATLQCHYGNSIVAVPQLSCAIKPH
jgi:hypothetical protein